MKPTPEITPGHIRALADLLAFEKTMPGWQIASESLRNLANEKERESRLSTLDHSVGLAVWDFLDSHIESTSNSLKTLNVFGNVNFIELGKTARNAALLHEKASHGSSSEWFGKS